jgi:class 3 adenylate cyclase
MTFEEILDHALAMLQRHGRVTYRILHWQFQLDDAALDDLKTQLLYAHPQVTDDEGQGLVWTGAPVSDPAAAAFTHVSPRLPPADAPREESLLASRGSDVVPALPTALVRPTPEAERRQLTVLFCDLVGSTQLSGQLDPADLRAVVRAYQEAAAGVIQSYEGHIAQYLGDGLLVYFGYPTAHEDDARRAVHTGLGMVQTIAALNTRLATQYGVELAVRLGIHTGPVVVGQMGGGGRHEHLALGETPNLAARLQGLATANAVVISAVLWCSAWAKTLVLSAEPLPLGISGCWGIRNKPWHASTRPWRWRTSWRILLVWRGCSQWRPSSRSIAAMCWLCTSTQRAPSRSRQSRAFPSGWPME